MEKSGKKFENDKTYKPKDKKEKELLKHYKQASEIIRKKANLLLSYNLINFINSPLSELYTTKEKLHIEDNINTKQDKKVKKNHL